MKPFIKTLSVAIGAAVVSLSFASCHHYHHPHHEGHGHHRGESEWERDREARRDAAEEWRDDRRREHRHRYYH